MKNTVAILALLFTMSFSQNIFAQQQGTPNIKECTNYFMHYFNEAVVQGFQIQELLKSKTIDGKDVIFYIDLSNRLEKTLGLVLNLKDIYYLYGKTTYCFTKDEKKYLIDRITNISDLLNKITTNDFEINLSGDEKDIRARESDNIMRFRERVERLRAFIETSLPIFK